MHLKEIRNLLIHSSICVCIVHSQIFTGPLPDTRLCVSTDDATVQRQTSSLSQGADHLAAVLGKGIGNSLVAQWLGLYAFTAKGTGLILSQGTRIPQVAQYGKKI